MRLREDLGRRLTSAAMIVFGIVCAIYALTGCAPVAVDPRPGVIAAVDASVIAVASVCAREVGSGPQLSPRSLRGRARGAGAAVSAPESSERRGWLSAAISAVASIGGAIIAAVSGRPKEPAKAESEPEPRDPFDQTDERIDAEIERQRSKPPPPN